MRAAVKSSWAFEFFRYFLTRGLVHTLSRQTQAQWDRYWFNLSFSWSFLVYCFPPFLSSFWATFPRYFCTNSEVRGPAYILVGLLRSWRTVELGLVALLHQRAARQACTLTRPGCTLKLFWLHLQFKQGYFHGKLSHQPLLTLFLPH